MYIHRQEGEVRLQERRGHEHRREGGGTSKRGDELACENGRVVRLSKFG